LTTDGTRDEVLSYLKAIDDPQFPRPVKDWIWAVTWRKTPDFSAALDY
jgi:hypothetical protein